MKKWIDATKELPPVGKIVRTKLVNRVLGASSTILPEILYLCYDREELSTSINDYKWILFCDEEEKQEGVPRNYSPRRYKEHRYYSLRLDQVSHWEKETFEQINNRWEILDL